MKILKPKFWSENNSFISYLLLPISLLYQILIFIKKSITKSKKFRIPIICVGNIYLGGTGKTPLALLLMKLFEKSGRKPAIIKKYYRDHFDEHEMIRSYTKQLFLHKNRKIALNNAEKNNFDLAILDDGFQDPSIKRDFNILCFNSNQLIGNGFTIPSGPLREGLKSVKKANVIVINGKKNDFFEKKILEVSKKVAIFYSNYEPINIDEFKNKKILAFAGIGNPENFFQMLEENKIEIQKKIIFPDHYEFSKNEIEKIIGEASEKKLIPLTSEKDYFRIKKLDMKNINYIKVRLKINEEDNFLKKIYDLI